MSSKIEGYLVSFDININSESSFMTFKYGLNALLYLYIYTCINKTQNNYCYTKRCFRFKRFAYF